jgi:hypothetical protein
MIASDQTQPEPHVRRLTDSVELIGKIFLLFTGICYAFGLIVVNIRLARYGIYSLNLLQLNYVTAGIWSLLPILLAGLGAAFGIHTYHLTREQMHTSIPTWIRFVYAAIMGPLAAFFLPRILGFTLGWSWFRVSLLGAIVGFALVMVIIQPYRVSSLEDLAVGVGGRLVAGSFLIFYLAVFAKGAYSEIPAELGGGRPDQVSFVVDSATKPYLQAAGLQFATDSNKSEPVELILATDREYIFLSKSAGTTTSIPNIAVKAVLHKKE